MAISVSKISNVGVVSSTIVSIPIKSIWINITYSYNNNKNSKRIVPFLLPNVKNPILLMAVIINVKIKPNNQINKAMSRFRAW